MKISVGVARPCVDGVAKHATCIRSLLSVKSATMITVSTTVTTNVRIGKRWGEYQGTNNWDGLLHPLDDTLRSEILRYGEFVQAAYTAFDADPSSSTYAACKYSRHSLLPRSGFCNSGYRVTRNLHAASSIRLPRWAAAGPAWLSNPSSWIGYVAVCEDEEEIARLGRRDIVVALRGTVTCLEWLENLRATLTHLPCTATSAEAVPMVESGFWSLFTSPGPAHRSLRDELRDEIRRLLDAYGADGRPLSLTITGHSLGAALAALAADDVIAAFGDAPMTTVVSFGGPRVGNGSFRQRLEDRGIKVLRIVNNQDIVTKVPGFVNDGGDAAGLLSRTGWVYADIGRELRLDGRWTANVVECHDLGVYLSLVNQLKVSCPFKTDDRRTGQSCAGRSFTGDRGSRSLCL